jgi:hypothetical protein
MLDFLENEEGVMEVGGRVDSGLVRAIVSSKDYNQLPVPRQQWLTFLSARGCCLLRDFRNRLRFCECAGDGFRL